MSAAPTPTSITMIKKRLANGDPCEKCAQTEDMLRRRGVWDRIDEVVWALEGDERSEGAVLGKRHGVKVAPFFILRFDDGSEAIYTSGMRLLRDHLSQPAVSVGESGASTASRSLASELAAQWQGRPPAEIVRLALERFRERCAVVLTGGEDVVLLEMAVQSGLPFRTVFVDTGRHRAETYRLMDELSRHYGIEIHSPLPDRAELVRLLEEKGQNSFLREGHEECCAIRRLGPLARALAGVDAWIGHHRVARELTATKPLAAAELDLLLADEAAGLVRVNPLLDWNNNALWSYVRKHGVPHNELHGRGHRFIGCEPCTRPIRPDQPDVEGLWWWEGSAESGRANAPEGEGI